MRKRYYSIETLKRELRSFERQYRLSSERFYRGYVKGVVPKRVSAFDRVVWADTYYECERLAGLTTAKAATTNGRAQGRQRAFQPAH